MNQKLSILMVFFAFLFSGSVFAQDGPGHATQPYAGSIHSYWVNGGSDGTIVDPLHKDNTYQWFMTDASEISGGIANALPENDFVFNSVKSGAGIYKVGIVWKSSAVKAAKVYYLHVKEINSNNLCSNEKVIAINPTNGLTLDFNNSSASGSSIKDPDPYLVCAPDVVPKLVANAIKYDYGITSLYYKVVMNNIDDVSSWSFNYAISSNNTFPYTPSITAGNFDVTSGKWTADASIIINPTTINVPAKTNYTPSTLTVPSSCSTIWLKIDLDNNQGKPDYSNPFEGTSLQPITLTLSGAVDATNNINAFSIGNGGIHVQDVNARPATSSPISHD